MTANELRIGNLVEYPNWNNDHSKEYFKITDIYFEDKKIGLTNGFIQLPFTKLQNIKPIPLTEEWLLKLGFEKVKGGISFDKGKLSIYLGDTILSGKNGRTYFNSWSILEESPKYVHQLQNLYFVLIGEELTFKSE